MTVVVAVDLAVRAYAAIGIAVLESNDFHISVRLTTPAALGLSGSPDAAALAESLARLAHKVGALIIAIDGPQAWKDPHNGLQHSRQGERALHTQSKTGLPGIVKPGPALRFVEFSIRLFDHLAELGWSRLAGESVFSTTTNVAIEVYPTAAWRALGLKPLPAKNSRSIGEVNPWLTNLQAQRGLTINQPPTHDELQALVAGLVGLALADGDDGLYKLHGTSPFLLDGHWREGYIVNPR